MYEETDPSVADGWFPLQDNANWIRVEVHLTEHPSVPAGEVWAVEFYELDLARPAWTRDWLVREVERLAWHDNERVSSNLRLRQDSINWGASASGYSVILQIAEWIGSGITGSVAYHGFKNLIRLMRSRMEAAGFPRVAPLTRDEAISRARWRVSSAYDVGEDGLRLVAEDHDIERETWTITLTDSARTQYEVTLGIIDGLPLTSRIIRRMVTDN